MTPGSAESTPSTAPPVIKVEDESPKKPQGHDAAVVKAKYIFELLGWIEKGGLDPPVVKSVAAAARALLAELLGGCPVLPDQCRESVASMGAGPKDGK
jgi:hypothetical protein